MARPSRKDITTPGEIYHVYARGNDGMTLFSSYKEYAFYKTNIVELKAIFDVAIFHYSLMPNHVHILLSPMDDPLSDFMKVLQNRYAKRFCAERGFRGHVWQGRFKQRHIHNDADLFACGNYIEMNPVRAGLVTEPETWDHSSYRCYAFGAQDRLIDVDPFYANLGRNADERQKVYRDTVRKTRR